MSNWDHTSFSYTHINLGWALLLCFLSLFVFGCVCGSNKKKILTNDQFNLKLENMWNFNILYHIQCYEPFLGVLENKTEE